MPTPHASRLHGEAAYTLDLRAASHPEFHVWLSGWSLNACVVDPRVTTVTGASATQTPEQQQSADSQTPRQTATSRAPKLGPQREYPSPTPQVCSEAIKVHSSPPRAPKLPTAHTPAPVLQATPDTKSGLLNVTSALEKKQQQLSPLKSLAALVTGAENGILSH